MPDAVHHVDLAALTVLEDQDFFHFELLFYPAPSPSIQYNELDFYMEHAGQAYLVDLDADAPTGAEMHRIDPLTGQSSLVGPLEADLSDSIVKKVMVPSDLLLGADGAPRFPRPRTSRFLGHGPWPCNSCLLGQTGGPPKERGSFRDSGNGLKTWLLRGAGVVF